MTSTGCVISLHLDVTGVCALSPEQIEPIYPDGRRLNSTLAMFGISSLPCREERKRA